MPVDKKQHTTSSPVPNHLAIVTSTSHTSCICGNRSVKQCKLCWKKSCGKNSPSFWEPSGENGRTRVGGIVMEALPAIWPPHQVPSRSFGQFQTQASAHYSQYEPQIAKGLIQMGVSGVRAEKVGEVVQTLIGVAPSARARSTSIELPARSGSRWPWITSRKAPSPCKLSARPCACFSDSVT
jgi:hypothetical protein